MKHAFLYITVGGTEEAASIARVLLDARLIACANIIDGAKSLYRWEGKIAEEKEVVMIAKTREDLVGKVIDRVRQLHSYDCPCIVALPIVAGNPAFLDWIDEETA
ncbi:MAG: divalent-cation tolerance protein CutA [Proteobacteria bacterium]|nr:divalent-cation tolerance protein CutA [Pseudomonadota bacterium]MCH8092511.1 divalent-cation tolerance protein CutA [Pseudomonadota bacterium]MCH8098101.1 divalent-cation tolerance protein CutA [Pseudomonadota bacterium]